MSEIAERLKQVAWDKASDQKVGQVLGEYEARARHEDWLYERLDSKLMWLAGAVLVSSSVALGGADTTSVWGWVRIAAGILFAAASLWAAFAVSRSKYSTSAVLPKNVEGVENIESWLVGGRGSFDGMKIVELAAAVAKNRDTNRRKSSRFRQAFYVAGFGVVVFVVSEVGAYWNDSNGSGGGSSLCSVSVPTPPNGSSESGVPSSSGGSVGSKPNRMVVPP